MKSMSEIHEVKSVQDRRPGRCLSSPAMTISIVWAAPLAALASFAVGAAWYAPPLLGRYWQRLCGLSDEQLRSGNRLAVFGGSFVAALVGAVVLAFFVGDDASAGFGALAGALVGAGWITTALVATYVFERRPIALALVDGGYHTVTYTVMGLLLGWLL
jgi:hypothetical protein